MTMPAMAPPERPVPVCVAVMPVRELPSVPTGVWKGTVAVKVPVSMTVCVVALVGRMNAEAVVSAVD